jgi:hypothetical protein
MASSSSSSQFTLLNPDGLKVLNDDIHKRYEELHAQIIDYGRRGNVKKLEEVMTELSATIDSFNSDHLKEIQDSCSARVQRAGRQIWGCLLAGCASALALMSGYAMDSLLPDVPANDSFSDLMSFVVNDAPAANPIRDARNTLVGGTYFAGFALLYLTWKLAGNAISEFKDLKVQQSDAFVELQRHHRELADFLQQLRNTRKHIDYTAKMALDTTTTHHLKLEFGRSRRARKVSKSRKSSKSSKSRRSRKVSKSRKISRRGRASKSSKSRKVSRRGRKSRRV